MKSRARCQEYVPFHRNICIPGPYGKLKHCLETYFPFKNGGWGCCTTHNYLKFFLSYNNFSNISAVDPSLPAHEQLSVSWRDFLCLTARTKHLEPSACLPLGQDLGLAVVWTVTVLLSSAYLESLHLTGRACLSLGEDRGGFGLLFTLGLPDGQACVPTAIRKQNWIPLIDFFFFLNLEKVKQTLLVG